MPDTNVSPVFQGFVREYGDPISYEIGNNQSPSPSFRLFSDYSTDEKRGFVRFSFSDPSSALTKVTINITGNSSHSGNVLVCELINDFGTLDANDFHAIPLVTQESSALSSGSFSVSFEFTSNLSQLFHLKLSLSRSSHAINTLYSISISSITATTEVSGQQITISADGAATSSGVSSLSLVGSGISLVASGNSIASGSASGHVLLVGQYNLVLGINHISSTYNLTVNYYLNNLIGNAIASGNASARSGVVISLEDVTTIYESFDIQSPTFLFSLTSSAVSNGNAQIFKNSALNISSTAVSTGICNGRVNIVLSDCNGNAITSGNILFLRHNVVQNLTTKTTISSLIKKAAVIGTSAQSVSNGILDILSLLRIFEATSNAVSSGDVITLGSRDLYLDPVMARSEGICFVTTDTTIPIGPFMLKTSRLVGSDYVSTLISAVSAIENSVAGLLGLKLNTNYNIQGPEDIPLCPMSMAVTGGSNHSHNGSPTARVDHNNLLNAGNYSHADIDAHLVAARPHSGHEMLLNKGKPGGYVPLNHMGVVPMEFVNLSGAVAGTGRYCGSVIMSGFIELIQSPSTGQYLLSFNDVNIAANPSGVLYVMNYPIDSQKQIKTFAIYPGGFYFLEIFLSLYSMNSEDKLILNIMPVGSLNGAASKIIVGSSGFFHGQTSCGVFVTSFGGIKPPILFSINPSITYIQSASMTCRIMRPFSL